MLNTHGYFHDRLVLLLLSVNSFLAALTTLSTLFRLSGGGDSFIVQYRAPLGIGAYQPGSISQILAFIGFVIVVLVVHAALSWRTYRIKRELSILILALGTLLLVMALIVSNELLSLR
jgi:hypothetical protein